MWCTYRQPWQNSNCTYLTSWPSYLRDKPCRIVLHNDAGRFLSKSFFSNFLMVKNPNKEQDWALVLTAYLMVPWKCEICNKHYQTCNRILRQSQGIIWDEKNIAASPVVKLEAQSMVLWQILSIWINGRCTLSTYIL